MRTVLIALLAAFIGGISTWLYGDAMAERSASEEHTALKELTDDYIAAINNNDYEKLEQITIGQANIDLSYDISRPRPDFVSPPLLATLRAAVEWRGSAEIESFKVEALGDSVAVGYLLTSFPDPRHADRRSHLTNTSGQILFKKEDGVWRINGTVL